MQHTFALDAIIHYYVLLFLVSFCKKWTINAIGDKRIFEPFSVPKRPTFKALGAVLTLWCGVLVHCVRALFIGGVVSHGWVLSLAPAVVLGPCSCLLRMLLLSAAVVVGWCSTTLCCDASLLHARPKLPSGSTN